jgi:hypothetical protein
VRRTRVAFGSPLLVAVLIVGIGGNVAWGQVDASPREDVPSALDSPTGKGLPEPLIDTDELRSGGPPPDGIPAIDEPRLDRVDDVDWLDPEEPVLAFALGDEARAYPVRILIWHEIVNDAVDGVPVAITYCPLCNSAIAFDRRVGPRVLDFGTSGLLHRSDLVMYDRQTESLWPQFDGRAVAGVLTGTELTALPVSTVSWREWRNAHPEGRVLSRDTGHSRPYGDNPYPGYDQESDRPFLYSGSIDRRLPPKSRVVGIDDGERGVAVRWKSLQRRRVIELTTARGPVSVWWRPGTASALDAGTVSAGTDVGAAQAFSPDVDGKTLHFEADGEGFRDRETGSTWDFFGRATAGPLAGTSLDPVTHLDSFWFAWAAFHPDTRIVRR